MKQSTTCWGNRDGIVLFFLLAIFLMSDDVVVLIHPSSNLVHIQNTTKRMSSIFRWIPKNKFSHHHYHGPEKQENLTTTIIVNTQNRPRV